MMLTTPEGRSELLAVYRNSLLDCDPIWHWQVHDWSFAHFPDLEFGEWYGYLQRDGRVSARLKGNMWKGPFHLPRMLWYCWKLLEETNELAG